MEAPWHHSVRDGRAINPADACFAPLPFSLPCRGRLAESARYSRQPDDPQPPLTAAVAVVEMDSLLPATPMVASSSDRRTAGSQTPRGSRRHSKAATTGAGAGRSRASLAASSASGPSHAGSSAIKSANKHLLQVAAVEALFQAGVRSTHPKHSHLAELAYAIARLHYVCRSRMTWSTRASCSGQLMGVACAPPQSPPPPAPGQATIARAPRQRPGAADAQQVRALPRQGGPHREKPSRKALKQFRSGARAHVHAG